MPIILFIHVLVVFFVEVLNTGRVLPGKLWLYFDFKDYNTSAFCGYGYMCIWLVMGARAFHPVVSTADGR
ncbi:hypothetical protein V8F20_010342 [Naviculisporaceae sp. PSN 640]